MRLIKRGGGGILPKDIAEGFNDYFSNIGPDLTSKIDTSKINFETYTKSAESEFAAFLLLSVMSVVS
jgi:hypothetical protein